MGEEVLDRILRVEGGSLHKGRKPLSKSLTETKKNTPPLTPGPDSNPLCPYTKDFYFEKRDSRAFSIKDVIRESGKGESGSGGAGEVTLLRKR